MDHASGNGIMREAGLRECEKQTDSPQVSTITLPRCTTRRHEYSSRREAASLVFQPTFLSCKRHFTGGPHPLPPNLDVLSFDVSELWVPVRGLVFHFQAR